MAEALVYQRACRSQLIVSSRLLYSECKGEKISTPNSSSRITGKHGFLHHCPSSVFSSAQTHRVPGELFWGVHKVKNPATEKKQINTRKTEDVSRPTYEVSVQMSEEPHSLPGENSELKFDVFFFSLWIFILYSLLDKEVPSFHSPLGTF